MRQRYIIFSPYFGKLPINFNLWIKSCSYNKDFKFVVFTNDCVNCSIPKNVEIINLSFDEFKKIIQEKFDFPIALDNPYKLCDFKPVYGFVFSKMVRGYEYWGHCDMDLIFGDITKYFPSNIEDYAKISYLGHFCMYKNNNTINQMFKN